MYHTKGWADKCTLTELMERIKNEKRLNMPRRLKKCIGCEFLSYAPGCKVTCLTPKCIKAGAKR